MLMMALSPDHTASAKTRLPQPAGSPAAPRPLGHESASSSLLRGARA